jgi:hypothetical protein
MKKARQPLLVLAFVTLGVACSSSAQSTGSDSLLSSKRYSSQTPPPSLSDHESLSQSTLVVDPDFARVPITVRATDQSAGQVTDRMDKRLKALGTLLSQQGGCQLELRTHGGAQQSSGERWTAQVGLEMQIDLAGLKDATSRKGRIDHCLLPLWEEAAQQTQAKRKSSEPHSSFQMGSIQLAVRNVDQHRGALHAAVLTRLGAVARSTDVVSWQPEDLHCHSDGHIKVVTRNLDGIRLALDTNCRFVPPSPQAPAPPP